MSREIEGYAIEICGEIGKDNVICECFQTWDEAIKQLSSIVEKKADQYDAKPICLLRLSSQQTCDTTGVASVYSFTNAGIIIQIRAIFKGTSFLQEQPVALSSSVN